MKRMYSIFNRSPTSNAFGVGGYYPSMTGVNLGAAEKSIIGAIFNRIAIDVSNNKFMHVEMDEEGFIEKIPDSPFNRCLRYRPNLNQTPSQFIRDIVLTMCSEGVAVVAPTYTDDEGKPAQLQVGTAQGWLADGVQAQFFNNEKQTLSTVFLKKTNCAIIENPLYTVMNDHASSIKRLISKLGQMDSYTAAATSGKIQFFVGLDYDTTTAIGTQKAEIRKEGMEEQMKNNKFGAIFHSNLDKITFPNKPLDIDIVEQVKYLEEQVFAELGITRSVFTGEAKEDANRQYQAKTVEPFCQAIAEALTYAFIPSDMFVKERIVYTKPMFSGVTGTEIADMSDKLSRNAIVKSNEVRRELGLLKSDEPQANMLMNPNMPLQDQPMADTSTEGMLNIFNPQANQNDTGASSSVPNIFK